MKSNYINILGINFFNGQIKEVIKTLKADGLLIAPSDPGLDSIEADSTYYQSLLKADIVIADSG
ncbi:hypothetical protein [Litoribacter populi]|uniref:hypothetical protein n=1 Tax=Litoribacter populi TaxID=2598460 RepID=UPI00117D258C|nr:hypothetical protein [Litoribacter populi]